MGTFISIVICTWNRERLLRAALETFCNAKAPIRSGWEVLVVLNNCTDGSAAVIEEFRNKLPICSVLEPRPGLSFARNRGIDAARGHFIIWTDDDVRVECEWLRAYEHAFYKWPEAVVFGGSITAQFEGGGPAWLLKALAAVDSAFAIKRVPPHGGLVDLASNDFPFGANYAIRSDVQRRYRYDPALGRRPSHAIIGGEEYELVRAILMDGGTGRWIPDAKVTHFIDRQRQTTKYLHRYFRGHGLVEEVLRGDRSTRSINRERWQMIKQTLRYFGLRMAGGSAAWVPALRDAATASGRLLARRTFNNPDPSFYLVACVVDYGGNL